MEKFMAILPYIFSTLGLISMIAASLVKGKSMKLILLLVFGGNLFCALSYFVGSGINGAASCFIGAAQAIINYFFDSKGKPLPKWLVAIYAFAFIGVNLLVTDLGSKDFKIIGLCVLAIVASLSFIMCIGQKSGAKYRFWTIVNNLLWCAYDVFSGAFSVLFFTHIPLLVFTVAGMIIHDRKKEIQNA